jgi:hypothetical protein
MAGVVLFCPSQKFPIEAGGHLQFSSFFAYRPPAPIIVRIFVKKWGGGKPPAQLAQRGGGASLGSQRQRMSPSFFPLNIIHLSPSYAIFSICKGQKRERRGRRF